MHHFKAIETLVTSFEQTVFSIESQEKMSAQMCVHKLF